MKTARHIGGLAWLVATMLLFSGCEPGEVHHDATPLEPAASTPQSPSGSRGIASLSPIGSAILVELGVPDRILAVDAESAAMQALAGRPRIPAAQDAALESLRELGVELVLVPESQMGLVERLQASGIEVLVVAVHDFDDGFALWRELGARLELGPWVHAQIQEVSRPLAKISAESFGWSRPRVAAIASSEPLALVGDHAFVTELIEIAGGQNVTHGMEDAMIPIERDALRRLAPELFVHASPEPLSAASRREIEGGLVDIAPVVFVAFDPAEFFGPSAVEAARLIRERIRPLSQPARVAH